jgi:hypothetical protein
MGLLCVRQMKSETRLERTELSVIDVLDRVLDKGIVIDYWARISLVGLDLLTMIEARIVVASIETYVGYAGPIKTSQPLAARI